MNATLSDKNSDIDSGAEIAINVAKNRAEWLLCPVCKNKTRDKIREDTILINFPLYCPKCRQETLINVQVLSVKIIKEPDAKAQSR